MILFDTLMGVHYHVTARIDSLGSQQRQCMNSEYMLSVDNHINARIYMRSVESHINCKATCFWLIFCMY